ncbi:MAG: TldD/PmbA family protein [Clostridia bacterium]|nr:TldD/PmbA family protein [Clostridia bacterium]
MAFSSFLEARRSAMRTLCQKLGETFDYVGILGADVRSRAIHANRSVCNIGEGSVSECGFVIKMHRGGAFYEYSLDDIEGDIVALAQKIVASVTLSAELAAREMKIPVPVDEPLVKSFARESDYDDVTNEELLRYAEELRDEILSRDENILNATVAVMPYAVSKLFVSKNRELDQFYSWTNVMALVIYREGEKIVSAREGTYSHLTREATEIMKTKVDILVDKAHHLAKAKPIVPGVYDVITAPSITGLIAHEAFGHGVEMDQFVKERALAREYVGRAVASPICNMRDGAGAVLSSASYFFDDDGVLAGDTEIIRDGILVAGISDLVSASELGTTPTGNGRRESYKRKAYTRMTNTFFCPGTDKLEDMIASISHGYMLFETNNGMEDPKNWQIQCTAEYGIEIVDGKLTDNYVSPVVMSGSVPELLGSISMVSDTFEIIGAGGCGKGYKEWVRVSDGGPALKVRVKLA